MSQNAGALLQSLFLKMLSPASANQEDNRSAPFHALALLKAVIAYLPQAVYYPIATKLYSASVSVPSSIMASTRYLSIAYSMLLARHIMCLTVRFRMSRLWPRPCCSCRPLEMFFWR
jgi:hypothetical protein